MSHQRLLSGLYAITDSQLIGDMALVEAVARASRGGAQVIQNREKHAEPAKIDTAPR